MISPSYQLLNQLVDFYEIWKSCDANQGDLDAIIVNHIASAILTWFGLKAVRWMH
jgi:hypothetical protein